jgi:poly-gamma-glutamate synthesis protein (capsule biosynthesis protein)
VEKEWVDLRIVVTGDVNLNRNRVEVLPEGSNVWGTIVPFPQFFSGVQGMIDGDINFCNLETVVTDRNDISGKDKAFCFRTHPNGVRVILGNGFNLLSLANNHGYDYGAAGVGETMKHLAALKQEYDFHYAGAGKDKEEAIRPALFTVKGIKVAFVALGIGHAATHHSPGVGQEIYYREALSALQQADADLRIFSCHDGKEGRSYPIDRQLRVYREAIGMYDVDIVIGHHPHVVQGIEHYQDGIIFYSLGNFMIRGAADMGKRQNGKYIRDFGLLGRVDLRVLPGEKKELKKLEIVPVYDMHQGVHPFASQEEADRRIDTMNDLSRLSSLNSNYVSRLPRSTATTPIVFEKINGRGVYHFVND